MEQYDKIDYSFGETDFISPNERITATDREGFITSQQYTVTDDYSEIDEYPENYDDPEPPRQRDRNAPKETVLTFQLAVCILLAIAAYALKSVGGEVYEELRTFYNDNINNSVIIEMDNSNNAGFVSEFLNDVTE